MILSFNDKNKYTFISNRNKLNFSKNYFKNKTRIDGYISNIINSINLNYKKESSLEDIFRNSYFISMTYNLEKIINRNNNLSEKNSSLTCSNDDLSALVVYEFRDFYNRFSRIFTKDRNFMRPCPHPNIPIVYCFLDAEGTRWGGYKDEYKNIHLHGLMVIPSRMHQEFELTIKKFGSDWKTSLHSCFDTMDIQRLTDYGLDVLTVPYVLSYASKFIPINSQKLIFKIDQEFLPRYGNKNLDYYN